MPPVALYLIGCEPDITAFAPRCVVTLALFIFIGGRDSEVLTLGAAAAPTIVAGVVVGGWLRGHAEAGLFGDPVGGLLVCVDLR